jgi:hypothetical protein
MLGQKVVFALYPKLQLILVSNNGKERPSSAVSLLKSVLYRSADIILKSSLFLLTFKALLCRFNTSYGCVVTRWEGAENKRQESFYTKVSNFESFPIFPQPVN